MQPTDPQTFFLQQGILGVIIVVMAGFVLWLFKRIDDKDRTIENRDQIIHELQEKRVVDYKENGEKIITASTGLLVGIQSLKEVVSTNTGAISKMLDNFIGRSK